MRFSVAIVSPPRYPHSGAFIELAETIASGLQVLGHEATIETTPVPHEPADRTIVLGAHLLPPGVASAMAPSRTIIYNLEQIGEGFGAGPAYLDLLARFPVWDYAPENVAALAALGISAQHVPIGYAAELERIPSAPEDIDVLFYGSVNERRGAVLRALNDHGVNAIGVFGAYGPGRDELIARSRIALSVHYYPTAIFEAVRVSYLCMNGRCVVAETPADLAFAEGVAFAPYAQIVDCCRALLDDPEERAQIAACGQAIMRARPESEILRRALAATPHRTPTAG